MSISLGIVDDDEAILYTVKAMAESMGLPIRCTSFPQTALKWVRENTIDLLLVDYHMPAMSGLEVIRSARQASSRIVLLALTIEEKPEIAKQLLLAGADDFISKPVRLADFSARISLHVELAKYRTDGNWSGKNKGMSEATARQIYSIFEQKADWLGIAEVAKISGLAYPTVHRYLEYLAGKGRLCKKTINEDGRNGRPKHQYGLTS